MVVLCLWWLWNYNDAEVSLCQGRTCVCWLGCRGIGWGWSICWFLGTHMVVVPVMLAVTLVAVMPLELNIRMSVKTYHLWKWFLTLALNV